MTPEGAPDMVDGEGFEPPQHLAGRLQRLDLSKDQAHPCRELPVGLTFPEAPVGIEPTNAALQAAVLPLDNGAMNSIQFSTSLCEEQRPSA